MTTALERAALQRLATAPRPYVRRTLLAFVVHGTPEHQGNLDFNRKTGKMYHQNSAALKKWRTAVAGAAHNAMEDFRRGAGWSPFPLAGPVAVDYIFALPKSASAPKGQRIYPVKRPDVSHLIRAAEDAMHVMTVHNRPLGKVFGDDSQIVRSQEIKAYPGEFPGAPAKPGVAIRVSRVLTTEEPIGPTCVCGCGTPVSRQAWAPGHDQVAIADVLSRFGGLVPFLSWLRDNGPDDVS